MSSWPDRSIEFDPVSKKDGVRMLVKWCLGRDLEVTVGRVDSRGKGNDTEPHRSTRKNSQEGVAVCEYR